MVRKHKLDDGRLSCERDQKTACIMRCFQRDEVGAGWRSTFGVVAGVLEVRDSSLPKLDCDGPCKIAAYRFHGVLFPAQFVGCPYRGGKNHETTKKPLVHSELYLQASSASKSSGRRGHEFHTMAGWDEAD